MEHPGDTDRRIIVWSRKDAETRNLQGDYIVISINNTPQPGEPNSSTWANVKEGYTAILRLNFDDIDVESKYLKPFNSAQAQSVVRFWNKWRNNCDQIMVHCIAGLSRSAGVATALSQLENIDGTSFYKYCHPNALIKRKIIAAAYNLDIGIW